MGKYLDIVKDTLGYIHTQKNKKKEDTNIKPNKVITK